MSISIVTIQEEHGTKPVTRSRVDGATACYYPDSRRVVLVADRADFEAGLAALEELHAHITGGEYLGCMECGSSSYYPPLDGSTP